MRTAIFAAITLSSSLAFAGLAPEEVTQLRDGSKSDVGAAVEAAGSLTKGAERPADNQLPKPGPALGQERKAAGDDLGEIDAILKAEDTAEKISNETK